METIDWIKFGIRWGLLGSWMFVLFSIKSYLATDKGFVIGFWIYVVIHITYVAIQSYKDYEDL